MVITYRNTLVFVVVLVLQRYGYPEKTTIPTVLVTDDSFEKLYNYEDSIIETAYVNSNVFQSLRESDNKEYSKFNDSVSTNIFIQNNIIQEIKSNHSNEKYDNNIKYSLPGRKNTSIEELNYSVRNGNVCPSRSVLTVAGGGRLGNCIWEYVTVFAVAKYLPHKQIPYSQKFINERLLTVIEKLSLPVIEDIPKYCECCKNVNWTNSNRHIYTFIPLSKINETYADFVDHIKLSECVTLYEPVLENIKEIKKEMTYKQNFIDSAYETMWNVREKYVMFKGAMNNISVTYIGVHVRRTDYLTYLPTYENRKATGSEYFIKAIQYFRENKFKFGLPLFLVVSDDKEWVYKNLLADDVFVVTKGGINNPGYDLALLSLCNHSIIDYGTFGMWGAIYTEGEVISTVRGGSQIKMIFSSRPNWHLVDITQKEIVIP